MLYLYTGTPGSSKTLNVIKFVDNDSAFKNRPIYYHRITDLTLPWTQLSADEIRDWQSLPDGSVVIVDEAQYLFPQRGPRHLVPPFLEALTEHRHRGFDFIFMTQHPKLIDTALRRLIGRHIHLERQFGLQSAKSIAWEKCVDDPEDYHKRRQAVISRVPFDKKYFGVYKSAEVHTHKKRVPAKIWILLLVMLLTATGVYAAISGFMDRADSTESATESLPANPGLLDAVSLIDDQSPGDQAYTDQFTPRLPDVPWSAPVYDDITKPQTFPRPQCYHVRSGSREGQCHCFTQQATKLTISHDACLNYVYSRYFDHTVAEDRNPEPIDSRAQRSAAAPVARATPRAVHIAHRPQQRMEVAHPRSYSTGAVTREVQ